MFQKLKIKTPYDFGVFYIKKKATKKQNNKKKNNNNKKKTNKQNKQTWNDNTPPQTCGG